MSVLNRDVAEIFTPLIDPKRYKAAWGGRGSGKSQFFAEQLLIDAIVNKGLLGLCVRETQLSLKQSSKRLIENKIHEMGITQEFKIWQDRIETPGDGVFIFQGMQEHNSDSIKSFEGFQRCWIEEAQNFSNRSLTLLRPTIRAPGSQIWASWNPRRKSDAVDQFFRGAPVDGAIVVKANWQDNPWFPKELEAERQIDLIRYPDRYDHIWEGEYAKALEGAYFAKELLDARRDGRIGFVAADPLLSRRVYIDIGGSGAKSDAWAMWVVQFVNDEIRVLNYYESVGQSLSFHVAWLRDNGYQKAELILPHDGLHHDPIGKTYQDHLEDAGFKVKAIKNQGQGAAMQRIEALRRLFPRIRFNETTTVPGIEALGFYHERRDETRQVGLGPDHDWSSHGADSFGLMAIDYEKPLKLEKLLKIPNAGYV